MRRGIIPRVAVKIGIDNAQAPYGLFVHENLQAHHTPPTRARFIEEPFWDFGNQRHMKDRFVVPAIRRFSRRARQFGPSAGLSGAISIALFDALEWLKNEKIIPITPIDTGNLIDSIFVEGEGLQRVLGTSFRHPPGGPAFARGMRGVARARKEGLAMTGSRLRATTQRAVRTATTLRSIGGRRS